MARTVAVVLFLLSFVPLRAEFRAGAAKVEITPGDSQWLLGYGARKSAGVLDPIFHRVLVLNDGKTEFALVASDICLVAPSEYDRVAALVKARLGIEPVHFWWSLTHTHAAPEVGPAGLPAVFMGDRYKHEFDHAYADMVAERLMDGIARARAAMKPARLAVGQGVSFANINRRARDVSGQTSLGLNPDGPADRRIGLLRLEGVDGSPIALVANYAIHGTVMSGANLMISGDAPGVVASYVEQKLNTTVLFVNGAAGDLAPIYSVYPNAKAGHMGEFRVLLGDKILQAAERMALAEAAPVLEAGEVVVETPRKDGIGWPAELAAYLRTPESGKPLVRIPVRVLRIGRDTAIWTAPLELFCEVAMGVRERSPFANTFYFGYTNGWLGYMPTEKEWPFGGYEPSVSPYTPKAEHDLAGAVLERLGRMRR